jgi:hypothetical protein
LQLTVSNFKPLGQLVLVAKSHRKAENTENTSEALKSELRIWILQDKAIFQVRSESLGRQAAVRTPSVSTAKSDDGTGGKLDYVVMSDTEGTNIGLEAAKPIAGEGGSF